ncbi:imidazolonepropionase [Cereibacter sphaeroides]|uniref:imidazolonepropionase n=1 Tax=Cereibacter sphaeroides TaxID=1063 RepID=UPI001F2FDFCE|nr:imidazolonepropionase [Cereibacter sphaeroides]MCE6952871.1 imidazolonepropionase [Cereibacter sphaeroides]
MMILGNLQVATMSGGYGLVPHAAVMVEHGRIAWVGPEDDLPETAWPRHDMGGRLCTPALIDCHTHAVFAGTRAAEFEMRLQGATYAEIAAMGGGIASTVAATRAATDQALLAATLPRIDEMLAQGVGTVEIKSGYGLDIETELRMLRVARRIGELRKVRVRTTYLGAHAVPPEFRGRPDAYIAEVALPALKVAQTEGLVDAVDGFCEGIAFSPAQIAHVFAQAHKLRLPVKLHAEQLSNSGGAALAARHDALSADHLEYLDAEGVAALAASGTVAVLLPGAYFTLRETQAPPVAALRAAGVSMAVATDLNPGTSPMGSICLAMSMACTLFGLTPEEALLGTTAHAARALGLADLGRIASGFRADLAIWDAEHPAELAWRLGPTPLHARLHDGEFV